MPDSTWDFRVPAICDGLLDRSEESLPWGRMAIAIGCLDHWRRIRLLLFPLDSQKNFIGDSVTRDSLVSADFLRTKHNSESSLSGSPESPTNPGDDSGCDGHFRRIPSEFSVERTRGNRCALLPKFQYFYARDDVVP
jgi:hypothetical protein